MYKWNVWNHHSQSAYRKLRRNLVFTKYIIIISHLEKSFKQINGPLSVWSKSLSRESLRWTDHWLNKFLKILMSSSKVVLYLQLTNLVYVCRIRTVRIRSGRESYRHEFKLVGVRMKSWETFPETEECVQQLQNDASRVKFI